MKTHPIQAKYANKCGEKHKQYLHAEIAAIIRCKDISKAYRIMVARFTKDGEPATAKPCPICMMAIKSSGIKIVEHT